MSTFKPSSILIIGATGYIGKYITNAILDAKPAFDKVVVFTSGNSDSAKKDLLSSWQAKGAAIVTGDVNDENDVKQAYKGIDTIICCLGRGALQHQVKLITLAEESGSVQWFFPSEYGTDIEYGPASAHEKPHQHKLATRKYIRENVKRMRCTYLVTGPYVESWFLAIPNFPEAGYFDWTAKKAALIDEGKAKIGFITMPDVGKCAVAALRHPDASFDKALKVQSFVITANEALAEFQSQTGGGEWAVEHTPLSKIKELEKASWDEGKPQAAGITLRRIWVEGGTLYDKTDNESIGLRQGDMETLKLAVKRAVDGVKP